MVRSSVQGRRIDAAERECVTGRSGDQGCNEVLLVGRLAAPAQERTLPSGDRLVTFRLVVSRPRSSRTSPSGPSRGAGVDTIDCSAWTSAARRQVLGWSSDDVVQVHGALRRRFWRSSGGRAASRYEVEVGRARRVRRATMGR